MKELAIIGVGIHKFGRFGDKSPSEIGQEAVKMALKDANVRWPDIQMAFMSRVYLPAISSVRILTPLGATGISMIDVEAACASGGAALRQAVLAIQAGACDIALAVGVEKMPRGFMDPEMAFDKWQVQMGMSTNPSYWALRARRHMHEFGITDLQIAKVAYKNHANSVNNPYAMYQKKFTMEEILASQLVCDPIHLLEICAPNEGAAAAIVCTKEKARKYTTNYVALAGCAHTVAQFSADLRAPVAALSARVSPPGPTRVASQKSYEMAGIGPEDVNVVELQDTDAFCELEAYEGLGLCKVGDCGRLIDDGVTQMGGKVPVNVSGGLISKGEPVGASHLGQVVEIVWQLRGLAGKRQVPNAKVGLAHVLGAGGHSAVTILKK